MARAQKQQAAQSAGRHLARQWPTRPEVTPRPPPPPGPGPVGRPWGASNSMGPTDLPVSALPPPSATWVLPPGPHSAGHAGPSGYELSGAGADIGSGAGGGGCTYNIQTVQGCGLGGGGHTEHPPPKSARLHHNAIKTHGRWRPSEGGGQWQGFVFTGRHMAGDEGWRAMEGRAPWPRSGGGAAGGRRQGLVLEGTGREEGRALRGSGSHSRHAAHCPKGVLRGRAGRTARDRLQSPAFDSLTSLNPLAPGGTDGPPHEEGRRPVIDAAPQAHGKRALGPALEDGEVG